MPTLAAYPRMLEDGRRREGLRLCRAAWLLGLTVREYRDTINGDRYFSGDEYERACRLYGWPERTRVAGVHEDPFDADVREGLSVQPPEARAELERVLNWPPEKRGELLRQLIARPELEHLATFVAMADSDNEVRLRLLRARGISNPRVRRTPVLPNRCAIQRRS